MKIISHIENEYFAGKIYENNIIEIKYKIDQLIFKNAIQVDKTIRAYLKNICKNENYILVLNFKNVEYIDSTGIGSLIQAKMDISKYNKKKSLIYCINLNKSILKTYKMIGLDHTVLLLEYDTIEDIIVKYIKK